MQLSELESLFEKTLADRRLSRGERRALGAILADLDPDPEERAAYLGRAFAAASEALSRHADRRVLDWLLALTKTIALPPGRRPGLPAAVAEAVFEPRQDCAGRLRSLIARSVASLDLCLFTLTDDRLARAVLGAHRRGLAVRLVTDDEKSLDPGSDVLRLRREGVAVRYDGSPDHMHHKFAVFDRRLVVTGSYNWTRSAAEKNHENIVVSDDERLVRPFCDEFDRLWDLFAPGRES